MKNDLRYPLGGLPMLRRKNSIAVEQSYLNGQLPVAQNKVVKKKKQPKITMLSYHPALDGPPSFQTNEEKAKQEEARKARKAERERERRLREQQLEQVTQSSPHLSGPVGSPMSPEEMEEERREAEEYLDSVTESSPHLNGPVGLPMSPEELEKERRKAAEYLGHVTDNAPSLNGPVGLPMSPEELKKERRKATEYLGHVTDSAPSLNGPVGLTMSPEDWAKQQKRMKAGASSVGHRILGSIPSAYETTKQTVKNNITDLLREEDDPYKKGYNKLRDKLIGFINMESRYGTKFAEERYKTTLADLTAQVEIAQALLHEHTTNTPVDPNLFGQKHMKIANEKAIEAVDGLEGVDRWLANTAMELLAGAPYLGVSSKAKILGAILGYASGAGETMYDANAAGYTPEQSFNQGASMVVFDAVLGKLPIKHWRKHFSKGLGQSALKEKLINMGFDVTEEMLKEVMDYAIYKSEKDPESKISLEELIFDSLGSATIGYAQNAINSNTAD